MTEYIPSIIFMLGCIGLAFVAAYLEVKDKNSETQWIGSFILFCAALLALP